MENTHSDPVCSVSGPQGISDPTSPTYAERTVNETPSAHIVTISHNSVYFLFRQITTTDPFQINEWKRTPYICRKDVCTTQTRNDITFQKGDSKEVIIIMNV